jgi:hypothetical protein
MTSRKMRRILAAGTLGLLGIGSVAAVPVASASAATHHARPHAHAAGRDATHDATGGTEVSADPSGSSDSTTDPGTDVSPDPSGPSDSQGADSGQHDSVDAGTSSPDPANSPA